MTVEVEVEGERGGVGGGGAAAGALDGASGLGAEGVQQLRESRVLSPSLKQPHVVLGHRASVPFLEGGGVAVDQGLGLGQLPFQRALMRGVGDENRAGAVPPSGPGRHPGGRPHRSAVAERRRWHQGRLSLMLAAWAAPARRAAHGGARTCKNGSPRDRPRQQRPDRAVSLRGAASMRASVRPG